MPGLPLAASAHRLAAASSRPLAISMRRIVGVGVGSMRAVVVAIIGPSLVDALMKAIASAEARRAANSSTSSVAASNQCRSSRRMQTGCCSASAHRKWKVVSLTSSASTRRWSSVTTGRSVAQAGSSSRSRHGASNPERAPNVSSRSRLLARARMTVIVRCAAWSAVWSTHQVFPEPRGPYSPSAPACPPTAASRVCARSCSTVFDGITGDANRGRRAVRATGMAAGRRLRRRRPCRHPGRRPTLGQVRRVGNPCRGRQRP